MTIEQLMKDDSFNKKLHEAKDIGDVAALFQEQGFDTNEEAIKALISLAEQSDELGEDTLEGVAGGISGKWPWNRAQDIRNQYEIALWIYNKIKG